MALWPDRANHGAVSFVSFRADRPPNRWNQLMTDSSTLIHPDLEDPDLLLTSARALSRLASTGQPVSFGAADVAVPAPVARMMARALVELASGNAVGLGVFGSELSTQQVADLLGVSRPFVVKEIEEGRLPARKIGPRRRVTRADFLSYRDRLNTDRQQALDGLARLDEALGVADTLPDTDTTIVSAQNGERGTHG